MTEWRLKGREFANCNCDYGCPCQFNALPTHGICEAAVGYQFDEGHHGDVGAIVKSGVQATESSGGLIDCCYLDSIFEFDSSDYFGQVIESA